MALSKKATLLGSLAVASSAALAYSIFIEPYLIETVEIHIYCPRLPHQFDGYRVLQLSDFHTRQFGRREKKVAELATALPEHDLILLTGDLIHTWSGSEPFIEMAKNFRAKDGIYTVFGNSEHKNGVKSKDLAEKLSTIGIQSLINSYVVVSRDAGQLYLVGVDDPASSHDNLPLALNGVPDGGFKLLMMHSPDPIGQAAAFGVDVVLSGHTHGGQVRFPFIGAVDANTVLGPGVSCGLISGVKLFRMIGFRPGRTQLYVSRGVGVSGLAMRFDCRPEITSITLHAND